MGGKSNLLDPEALQSLYEESKQYKKKADELSHQIRVIMNQLTDPIHLNRLKKKGCHPTLVYSILGGKQALEELLDNLKDTANNLDSTLDKTKSPWDTNQADRVHEHEHNKTLKR